MILETTETPLGFKIRWSKRAEYRLGSLADPAKLEDLSRDDHRFFKAVCDILWASQVAPQQYGSPEDIADLINHENLPELVKSLVDAILLAAPAPASEDKPAG